MGKVVRWSAIGCLVLLWTLAAVEISQLWIEPAIQAIVHQNVGGAGLAGAYSGSGSIWAQKQGDFLSTNFAGTTSGLASAYSYTGSNGLVHLGPGTEGLGFGSPTVGTTILRASYQGFDVAGRPLRAFPNGTERFRADSSGIVVTGKTIGADSARFNEGIQIGGEQIRKFKSGFFSTDLPSISPGTTYDRTVALSTTGLDVASKWDVHVTPNATMTDGLSISYAYVSADNSITIRFTDVCNAAAADNPNMEFHWTAFKE